LRAILREILRERELNLMTSFVGAAENFLGWVHFVLGVLGVCKEDSRSCKDLVEFVCVCVCVQEFCVVFFFFWQ
jgi:hypothetical protein